MAYLFLKDTHSIVRWLVLLACIWALVRLWSGLLGHRTWAKQDRLAGLIFTSILNLQVLLGIALYAISPITQGAMANFAGAMRDSVVRFFAVEHVMMMILAAIIAQVGFSLAKRTEGDRGKFLKSAIAYTIAALLIIAAIPWPFLKYGRPLFPTFGS